MKPATIVTAVFISSICQPLHAGDEFSKVAKPFITRHRASCHCAKKQKGKLRLDTLPTDFGDPEMLKKLAEVDRGYLSKLNRFLTFLKSTDEGCRPMLDHTMLVYGSGMNNGPRGGHSPKNLPLLVAGGRLRPEARPAHRQRPRQSPAPLQRSPHRRPENGSGNPEFRGQHRGVYGAHLKWRREMNQ